jgi:hypothetical protein
MESNKNLMTNFQVCIARLEEFVNTVPKGAGESVNWKELNQHRNLAEMSLTHLASILGGRVDRQVDRDCEDYPKL